MGAGAVDLEAGRRADGVDVDEVVVDLAEVRGGGDLSEGDVGAVEPGVVGVVGEGVLVAPGQVKLPVLNVDFYSGSLQKVAPRKLEGLLLSRLGSLRRAGDGFVCYFACISRLSCN